MTKFNPQNKKHLTYGECLDPAMKITNVEDAKQYFRDYVKFIKNTIDENSYTEGKSPEEIAKHNLGYYAGYFDDETRNRVESLFLCEHPIFGSIKENGKPTPEESFKLGMEWAQGKKTNLKTIQSTRKTLTEKSK
jgi:hypothetical protein